MGQEKEGKLVSFGVKNLFGLRIKIFLFLSIILIVGFEAIARSDWFQSRIPFQAFGTNHIQFEMQWTNWEKYVDQNGIPECFILGNSMALRDLVPGYIQEEFKQLSGIEMECYNFSVVGMRVVTLEEIADYVVTNYKPNLLIFGTSFLDYSQAREEGVDSRLVDNEWFRYQMGDFSLKGWLTDKSAAYRAVLYLGYFASEKLEFDRVGGIGEEIIRWRKQLSKKGAGLTDFVEKEISEPLTIAQYKKLMRELDGFEVSQTNMGALARIAGYSGTTDTQVILVILPFHPSLVQTTVDDDEIIEGVRQLKEFTFTVKAEIVEIGDKSGALVWEHPDISGAPENGWWDKYHLNFYGSRWYTEWFARELEFAVDSGELVLGGDN